MKEPTEFKQADDFIKYLFLLLRANGKWLLHYQTKFTTSGFYRTFFFKTIQSDPFLETGREKKK